MMGKKEIVNGKKYRELSAAVRAFLGTAACLGAAKGDTAHALTNSALSVLLFSLLWLACSRALKGGTAPKIRRICAWVGALFLGFSWQWGTQLDTWGSVSFPAKRTWLFPLFFAVWAAPVLAWAFGKADEALRKAERAFWEQKGPVARTKEPALSGLRRLLAARPVLFGALGLFLAWLPVFLAVYPGFFAYDATDELNEVLTGEYVTRHPLLHVLALGNIVSLGQKLTGNYNAGIAAYVLLQMAVSALLLSWALKSVGGALEKSGYGRAVRIGSWLFFAFFPVIPLFVLCTTKDTPYTLAMLAATVLLFRMGREKEAFWNSKGAQAGLAASLLLMALLRNNGFYIFLVMIPVLLVWAGAGRVRRMGVLLLLVLLCRFGIDGGLKAVLHPVDTDVQETLTVPIQQLARVWESSPETFSADDREAMLEILSPNALKYYTPKLSDPVKNSFHNEVFRKNPGRYFSLWARIGLKAPLAYTNAWLMTSYGFWYPDTVVDVYNGVRDYVDSSWFSFETEEPGVRESLLPGLEEVYRKISLEIWIQRLPVVSMLFSPGFLCWIYVLGGLYLISCGRGRSALSLLPLGLNWLTVLLGPTYLVRYVLILWFALPVLAAAVAGRGRTDGVRERSPGL